MENNLKATNTKINNIIQNNTKFIPKINFVTKNYTNNFIQYDDDKKICEYCNKKFYSKFDKERHIKRVHSKNKFEQKLNNDKKNENSKQSIGNFDIFEANEIKKNIPDTFIGVKRCSEINLKYSSIKMKKKIYYQRAQLKIKILRNL